MLFQGHDTTSSAIGFTIYILGRHPEIQRRCQAELDEVLGIILYYFYDNSLYLQID